uniref:Gfo/Idh/MocA-like oxidoreductase N-terminal domain-containing protein n=1 Tax=Octactis speculum TaxID=3111310 RepID=A0A7S2MRL6_9STRA|mmetsp:Transcript_8993/g.11482  ORF Transcript_8993/g.11482 Transcript_8993/m.11482 type:complete len:379 (+) Transcript_8993:32-1168(+)
MGNVISSIINHVLSALGANPGRITQPSVETIIVGCGSPNRGMGWFHARQMHSRECPSARLTAIVEPFFLGAGSTTPAGKEFAEFAKEWSAEGVAFYASLEDLPAPKGPRMALIAGRTADNPSILRKCIDVGGCTHLILEKPGAPTVGELEGMAEYAKDKGVSVYMGYNKNISSYVAQARDFEAKNPGASTKFTSLNAYTREGLGECFERNKEGLLKNMAIHELALAVTFYGIRGDNIKDVTINPENSECLTINGYTDFSKAEFTMTTTEGKSVTIYADRCAGNECIAEVSVGGKVAFVSNLPDGALSKEIEARQLEYPDWMPYFFLQEKDYRNLKELCASHVLQGKSGSPPGIATIEIAIEALKVAEYLTPTLQKLMQ